MPVYVCVFSVCMWVCAAIELYWFEHAHIQCAYTERKDSLSTLQVDWNQVSFGWGESGMDWKVEI